MPISFRYVLPILAILRLVILSVFSLLLRRRLELVSFPSFLWLLLEFPLCVWVTFSLIEFLFEKFDPTPTALLLRSNESNYGLVVLLGQTGVIEVQQSVTIASCLVM